MFCQKCGANVEGNSTFCPYCGNVMVAPQNTVNDYDATVVAPNSGDLDATVASPSVSGVNQPPQAPVTFMPVAPQPPQKKNTGLIAAIAVVSVIAVAAIVLVILLTTGVIGTDKKDNDKKDKEDSSVSQTAENEESDIFIDETESIKDKNDKENTESPTVPSNNNNSNSGKINRGKLSGDTYTVDYLGISFKKPSAWQFVSESELAELSEMSESDMNTDIAEYLENNLVFYEMMAKTAAGNKSVIIAYESLTATDSEDATVDEYFDGVKLGMDSVGLGYQYSEVKANTLGGKNFHSMVAYLDYNGYVVYQKIFVVMKDKVAATVIITATSEAELAEIEASFS